MKPEIYLKNLYPVLSYIFKLHILSLALLALIRVILMLVNYENVEQASSFLIRGSVILGGFIDNVTVSYISLLPLICAFFIALTSSEAKTLRYVYNAYYIITYTVVIGFTVADIPYFNYFFKHIDPSAIDWLKNDKQGIDMLFAESGYYKYYLLFFGLIALFSFLTVLFGRQWGNYRKREAKTGIGGTLRYIGLFTTLGLICFMGVAKKHHKMHPIKISTPYQSTNSFMNQMTISPFYNYIISIGVVKEREAEINFVNESDAFEIIKKDFGYKDFNETISPVCRTIQPEGEELRANMIIILMESMSSYFLSETPQLTPYLNRLAGESYYFTNIYSPGTHTNQGIFSTLYGIPAYFSKIITDDRSSKSSGPIPVCEGLPWNLAEKGYTNLFYLPHEKSYNNMDMFLYKNGYEMENIYSRENYPDSVFVNRWGAPDKYLFEFTIANLKEQHNSPFFASIMTVTNHPEYVIPKEFTEISKDVEEQAVYYSDYCIKKFMEDASKQEWYDNTIFVFLGDHGKIKGRQDFEMPLSLNHIPLIIYSPLFRDDMPKVIEKFGTQTDVFPTVMGLLNTEYDNNSLGVDLFRENRSYAVFTSDDKLGCINDRFLYCYNTLSKREFLYDYKEGSQEVSAAYKDSLADMRNYVSASVQVTNYLLKNRLTKRNE